MIFEEEHHEWEFRLVARFQGEWMAFSGMSKCIEHATKLDMPPTETIAQRRRKRDIYDPTPCEGIEHPIWRDWEASPDPEIQAVLVRKGMPFRSLEK